MLSLLVHGDSGGEGCVRKNCLALCFELAGWDGGGGGGETWGADGRWLWILEGWISGNRFWQTFYFSPPS